MEEYKYLYINEFKWLDEEGMSNFKTEPKPNSVYKAKEEDLFYKIKLRKNQENIGVALQKDMLKCEGIDGEAWICDIEVITSKNLFDLDISKEDLSMMANDVSHEIEFNPEGLAKIIKKDLKDSLTELRGLDEEMFEALARITTIMAQ